MPTLPNPDEFQRRSVTPRTGVVQYEGGIKERLSAGAAQTVGEAQADMGRAIGQVGEVIGRAAEREQQRLDRVLVDSGENELMGVVTDLSIKARAIRGENVLAKDYIKNIETEYDARAKQIEDKLQTPNQKLAIRGTADRAKMSLLRGVTEHAATEADRAKELGYKARIDAAVGMAASQPDNDEAMQDSIGIVVASAMLRADELGLDPTARDQFIQEAHGSVVAAAIDSKRQAGLVEEARQLFDVSKSVMTPDQVSAVEHRLKPVVESTFGTNLADEVFALKESGKITAVQAQKLINERTKGRPEANTAAEVALQELERRKREDTDNKVGTVVLRFQEADATEAAFLDVTKSPEFLALDVPTRAKLYQDLRTQVRVVARAERAEDDSRWKTQEVWEEFNNVMADPNLGKKTPEQIAAYVLSVGPVNAKKITAQYEELRKGAVKFKIDSDLLREAMPADLSAATKNGSPKKYKQAEAFRGIVEANLADWKARNPGAIPTLEDQKKIARSALAEYEEAGVLWGTNTRKLYEAPENEREQRRLEAQRSSWEEDMKAQAADRGIVLTPEKLQAMWNKKMGATK